MRKIFKNMAWTMAATLVMAACSDSLDESDSTGQGPLTGEGYVKVAINMPTTSGTRAFDEGTDLNDGIEKEWTVKNGIIAFFEGTTESEAQFVKAYDLGALTDGTGEEPQISNKVVQVAKVPVKTSATNTMYALVILNYGKNGEFASVDNGGDRLTLNNNGGYIILTPGSKVDALNGAVKWELAPAEITSTENGFLMMNAPLYNGTTSQTLVPVRIYATQDLANAGTADNIYVERIVAKVNVKIGTTNSSDGGNSLTVKDGVYAGDKVVFVDENLDLGWVLNVTNKNTKPLRDVSELSTWLTYSINNNFIGNTTVATDLKRIYWAIDNNYDNTTTDFNVYSTAKNQIPTTWYGYTDNDVQYCLENTAPAEHYNGDNTTAILIKSQYLVDGATDANKSFFKIGDISTTYLTQDFLSYIATRLSLSASDLSLKSVNAGYYEGNELKDLIEGIDAKSETDLLAIGKVSYYKNGDCYYSVVPIKHFQELTYQAGDDMTDEKYLGMYGVVRNNWYELTINSVKGPGAPEIEDNDNPLITEEGYINCTINVLSWAKRSQGVDL